MTYKAKITNYHYQIIEGKPAIVVTSINVFDDKGNYIRQAQLSKIINNLTNMQVSFQPQRQHKNATDHTIIRTLMETATGEYLTYPDKDIVMDWFIRAYPDEYRNLEGKYSDVSLDKEKKAIIFTNQGQFISAVEGIEL